MIRRFLLVLLVVFLAVSCVGPSESQLHIEAERRSVEGVIAFVYVDDSFSREERSSIVDAIDLWSRSTCGFFTYQLVDVPLEPNDVPLPFQGNMFFISYYPVNSNDEWVVEWDRIKDAQLLGLTVRPEDGSSNITLWLVVDRLNDHWDLRSIAAHEMGHALGAVHVADRRSIMSTLYHRDSLRPTAKDVESLCRALGCDHRLFPLCDS